MRTQSAQWAKSGPDEPRNYAGYSSEFAVEDSHGTGAALRLRGRHTERDQRPVLENDNNPHATGPGSARNDAGATGDARWPIASPAAMRTPSRPALPRRNTPQPPRRPDTAQGPVGIINYTGAKKPYAGAILDRASALVADPARLVYVEPFLGGGSVAATMLDAFPEAEFVLSDVDLDVLSVYECLQQGGLDWLTEQIRATDLNIRLFDALKAAQPTGTMARAYRRVVLAYSCYRASVGRGPAGGRENPDPDAIKQRWDPKRIVSRLRWWSDYLARCNVKLVQADYAAILQAHAQDPNALIYMDPPYLAKGEWYNGGLDLTHYEQMAATLQQADAAWLFSHDNQEPVLRLFDEWANVEPLPIGKGSRADMGSEKLNVLITPRRGQAISQGMARRAPMPRGSARQAVVEGAV